MADESITLTGIYKNYYDNTPDRKAGKNKPDNIVLTVKLKDEYIAYWPPKDSEGFNPLAMPAPGSKMSVPVIKRLKGEYVNYYLDTTREIVVEPETEQATLEATEAVEATCGIEIQKPFIELSRPLAVQATTPDNEPEQIAAFGRNAANTLKNIVNESKLSVEIQGHGYLKFEGWQAVANFFGCTARTENTKPILEGDKVIGFEARASVHDKQGRVLSVAEGSCSRDERQWGSKPLFQLRSMAQTRACAKALRNVFAWVVVMASFAPTPAEEMEVD